MLATDSTSVLFDLVPEFGPHSAISPCKALLWYCLSHTAT